MNGHDSLTLLAAASRPHQADWLGFDRDQWATVIAGAVAALVAAFVAVLGYWWQQRSNRRDQRAAMYAEALRAVEDYLEAPYRIRRRDGSHAARILLTSHVSDVQSRINFHLGWLRIHASDEVRDAYEQFVSTAKREAGGQMTAAWRVRPTRRDRDVPLGQAYPQPLSAAARQTALDAMRKDL